MKRRPYDEIVNEINDHGDRKTQMRAVVDALWTRLAETGVSWVGFYEHEGRPELVLGPSRNKPACSPIGLHGACGRAFLERRPLIVSNVRALGAAYVACDPRDRSEVVVPIFDGVGVCRGVLDLDSFESGAFGVEDVQGLRAVLTKAGLAAASDPIGHALQV